MSRTVTLTTIHTAFESSSEHFYSPLDLSYASRVLLSASTAIGPLPPSIEDRSLSIDVDSLYTSQHVFASAPDVLGRLSSFIQALLARATHGDVTNVYM